LILFHLLEGLYTNILKFKSLINPKNSSIDIRDVENGIYIVTLNNSSFLKSQKLTVNHEK